MLNSIIKSGKDRLERMEQCNVVYKISCLDCDSSYVSQTKRKIKTRINEHKTNIKKLNSAHNVVNDGNINLNIVTNLIGIIFRY